MPKIGSALIAAMFISAPVSAAGRFHSMIPENFRPQLRTVHRLSACRLIPIGRSSIGTLSGTDRIGTFSPAQFDEAAHAYQGVWTPANESLSMPSAITSAQALTSGPNQDGYYLAAFKIFDGRPKEQTAVLMENSEAIHSPTAKTGRKNQSKLLSSRRKDTPGEIRGKIKTQISELQKEIRDTREDTQWLTNIDRRYREEPASADLVKMAIAIGRLRAAEVLIKQRAGHVRALARIIKPGDPDVSAEVRILKSTVAAKARELLDLITVLEKFSRALARNKHPSAHGMAYSANDLRQARLELKAAAASINVAKTK